jgi:hypothetical protein
VRLRTAAIVGSESTDLDAQLAALETDYLPHVAVVVVGERRDAPHPGVALGAAPGGRDRLAARSRRRRRGGHLPGSGGAASRAAAAALDRVADVAAPGAAQAQAAIEHGATAVRSATGGRAMFFDQPEEMFGLDRFHPSALGYRRTEGAAPGGGGGGRGSGLGRPVPDTVRSCSALRR